MGHNGNESNNDNNSRVHNSVMNYRYQMAGTTPNGRHTYSNGNGGCATCSTSPKQSCINAYNAGTCSTNQNCDCDLNEWPLVNYDFYEGKIDDWLDGYLSTLDQSISSSRATNDPLLKQHKLDPQYKLAEREAQVPKENPSRKKHRVAKRIKALEEKGLRRGIDFVVSSDEMHIYME